MRSHPIGRLQVLIIAQILASGCIADLDTDSPADDPVGIAPAATSTSQALGLADLVATCPGVPGCNFSHGQQSYRVRFAPPGAVPPGKSSWVYPRLSVRVSGCLEDDVFCELDLKAYCAETAPVSGTLFRRIASVSNQRYTVRPYQLDTLWLGHIEIPSEGCLLQACTAPPSAVPALTIQTEYCRGLHNRAWTSVPGATFYQGQAKPMLDYNLGIGPTTPWSVIPLGYQYPGIMIDTSANECRGNSSSSYYLRMRACNECGCSAWSAEQLFQYWTGDCA